MKMTTPTKSITIRVYGILIKDKHEILISEEWYKSQEFRKFPGGGMEAGESTISCLKRELLEETGLEIMVESHFYTTDLYVISAFDQEVQVMSIYYLISCRGVPKLNKRPLNRGADKDEIIRFVPLKTALKDGFFSFPIDQHVAKLLKAKYAI